MLVVTHTAKAYHHHPMAHTASAEASPPAEAKAYHQPQFQTSKNLNLHVLGNFNVLELTLKTFHFVQGLQRTPFFFLQYVKTIY
jgi:hypothetical protein